MLKGACNNTLPASVCLLPNYTVPWDATKSLYQTTQEIANISTIFLGIPIILIGIITSLLCTILFFCYSLTQKSTRLLLIANSVVDTVYLVVLAISRLVGNLIPVNDYKVNHILIFDGISNFLGLFRNWTTVLIAFERFMLICHPLMFKAKVSNKWVLWAIIGASIGTIIVRIPTVITIIFVNLKLCKAATISFSIDAFADVFFFTVLPLILLIAFTMHIQVRTRRLKQWRGTHQMNETAQTMACNRMNKRVHGTIMIVLISFTILTVPFLPNGILRMIIAFGNDGCLVYLARYITAAMAYVGTLLNSTLNCFIYLATWPKFRRRMWEMLVTPFGYHARRKLCRPATGEECRSEAQTRAENINEGDL